MLDALFSPKTVAVIGASTKELSIGNRIIKNLVDFGYRGKVYPINPKADEVRGIKAYPSILDVPGDVDLVHIVIPNKFVSNAIADCGKKNVKVAIVNTAGFKEIGSGGVELERELVAKAKEAGIRVFGPNCQGIINTDPDVKAYCNFTYTMPEPGNISIAAQSGGVGEVINQRLSELGIGVRMYASNGNACDISIPEVIRYWGEDDQTRVIILHIENLSDPGEFMAVAIEVAAKKPILAMKTGRTEEGAKAVSSHTGGLAKVDVVTELLFKKCGIISFKDEEEMCQAAVAFACQSVPKGRNVGMITNTGGPAIIATDELVDAGLTMPPLSDSSKEELRGRLFDAASVSNPIDVLATGNAEHFRAAMDALMADDNIDSVLINFVTPFFVDTESIAREIAAVNKVGKKPVVCNLMTDKSKWTETINILKEGRVPIYSFPETAARSLVALTKYGELKNRVEGTVKEFDDVDRARAKKILDSAKEAGRETLSAEEVYGLLAAYRIPTAKWGIAKDSEEAVRLARDIGFPVALKVDAEQVVHKSDVGAIALDLNEDELSAAVADMEKRFSTHNPRYLVQKFVVGGRETIIGAKKEKGLGHLVLFGFGGVYVEILKDVSFGIAPLTVEEAGEMVESLKMAPLLSGFRGERGVDKERLTDIIMRVSQLVEDNPEIREMDLNPVMAFENKAMVVDARIMILV